MPRNNNLEQNGQTAYAFRIHEPKTNDAGVTPTAAATMNGWTQTNHISEALLENIAINNVNGKIGTSIPSIFARIHLFNVAFQSFNGKGYGVLSNPPQTLKMEATLVSECFDLLEFLFQHGRDNKLKVKRWNAATQIAALRAAGNDNHTRLAQVLEDEIAHTTGLQDIYLFYWEHLGEEILIGGTSPFTLVFTSPNWKRTMNDKQLGFASAGGGTALFTGNTTFLNNRDADFVEMIYALYVAFNTILPAQAQYFNSYLGVLFANYNNMNAITNEFGGNPAVFYSKYVSVRDIDGGNVVAYQLPLCYKQIKVVSGYEIVPTSDRYKQHIPAGEEQHIPLMLDRNGLTGVTYIGHTQWNSTTCQIDEPVIRRQELHQRQLPGGMGVVYPFLIWSDLLEDKIVKVPFAIDKDKFITATVGDAHYLLPLRRKFFDYFNISDVETMVSVTANGNAVTVTVNVPLNNNIHSQFIISHQYNEEDIVSAVMTLGVFPFYKTGNNDRYSILKCSRSSLSASFYDVTGTQVMAQDNVRTQETTATYQTRYYDINGTFDIIEINDNSNNQTWHALVIPKLEEITQGNENFVFAVDFGTSNTHIAYTKGNAAPRSLEFTGSEQQTVYLHTGSIGELLLQNMSENYISREFAPKTIGKGERFSLPTTSAVCELNPVSGQSALFGTVSAGFNMMYEQTQFDNARYITQLKWLLEQNAADAHNTAIIKLYFKQILWMLKNKALQDGGSTNFEVRLTFPETMIAPLKNAIINCWQDAQNDLQLNGCIIAPDYSESIAPYNVLLPKFGASSFLNIDIGGGTHDMLFVNRDNAGNLISSNFSSTRFAGNDLWGDGMALTNPPTLRNGFAEILYKYIDGNRNHYDSQSLQTLDLLRNGVANTSSDIMGYLFSNERIFNTTNFIRNNQTAYSIVFIHYMALMYHVARLIKKQNVGIPNYISFTGMGSKYINIISPNAADIKDLTKMLLEKYVGKMAPQDFTIIANIAEAKEITAKGTLTTPIGTYVIPDGTITETVDYGFDTNRAITYNEVRSNEIQENVMQEYNKFLSTLTDKAIFDYIHQKYGLTMSDEVIKTLKSKAQNSYNSLATAIPESYAAHSLRETLFFYPLKEALIDCTQLIKYEG